jgi:flavin reductase (DIM6/NTAB) family NADH-FMN oxidoreductase RutF
VIDAKPKGGISSLSGAGEADLTLYHFFDAFNRFPLVMGFVGDESKESIRNIAQTGEFSWNLSGRTHIAANYLSASPALVVADGLAKAALTPIRSRNISAHRIAESGV